MSKLVKSLFGGESDEGIERAREKQPAFTRDFLAQSAGYGS